MDLGIAQTFSDATWMNIDILHIEFTFAHEIIIQIALHTIRMFKWSGIEILIHKWIGSACKCQFKFNRFWCQFQIWISICSRGPLRTDSGITEANKKHQAGMVELESNCMWILILLPLWDFVGLNFCCKLFIIMAMTRGDFPEAILRIVLFVPSKIEKRGQFIGLVTR